MPLLNYTTTISASRTLAEVQQLLGEHGAAAVQVRYENREPVGVAFTLAGPHGDRTFELPVDIDAVHRYLNSREAEQEYRRRNDRPIRPNHRTREHAARVAWRTAQDWLEAQLAMVQAKMAQLDQVMLPYLVVAPETTLYQAYREREQAALEAGG